MSLETDRDATPLTEMSSVLEARLTKCEAELAEKNSLVESLLRELQSRQKAIDGFLVGSDSATRLAFQAMGVVSAKDAVLERSIGRLRSPLEQEGTLLRTFNGKNGVKYDLPSPLHPPYSLKVRFRSLRSSAEQYGYSKNSPPMPMVLGPLALSLRDADTARIFIGRGDKFASYDFFDGGDWIDVAAVVTSASIIVYVDGKEVLNTNVVEDRKIPLVRIGCGHLERGWAGQIASIVVVKGDWPVNDTNIPDDSLAFHFNGTTIVPV